VPKQLKEASVPRKCNVLIIINNKYIIGLLDGQGQEL
jgi:hypothetical protein